jgi:hypothetical protein
VGVELELLAWRNSIPVATWPALTTRSFVQEHAALAANLSGRLPVSGGFQSYLYGGVGGGLALSRLDRSRAVLGPVLSLLGGVSLPLGSKRWRVSLEGRYLITRDFDAEVREQGVSQKLEFSGHRSNASARPIFGPHMDSRFIGVLLGFRWTNKTP